MPQNVIIKRFGGSSIGWEAIYPKTTWSQIEDKPSMYTPASHNHDGSYVKYGGNHSELETDSPAANAKSWVTSANLPNGNALVYNSKGKEYSLLYSFNPSNLLYGTILKWGYDDKYIRLLRYRQTNNGWQSADWEKISAGYADTSGSVVLTEQTSVWNDNNIKGNGQGSSIGFNTSGKIGFRAIVTTENKEDAILFRVNSNTRLRLGDTKLSPYTTDQYSLGSSDYQFNNIYGKTIYENGIALDQKYATKNIFGGQLSDLDSIPNTGFYEVASSYSNGPSWLSVSYGQLLSIKRWDTYTQFLGSYSTGRLFTRSGGLNTSTNTVIGGDSYNYGYSVWNEVVLGNTNYVCNRNTSFAFDPSVKKISNITTNNSWNSFVASRDEYKECRVTFTADQQNKNIIAGISVNATSVSSLGGVDYCWYLVDNGNCTPYEAGNAIGYDTYGVGDEFIVDCIGNYIHYYHNGKLIRQVARTLGSKLGFNACFHSGGSISNVVFEPVRCPSGSFHLGFGGTYINFRDGHDNYDGGIYYSTPGNEALVFANKNPVTSWIFVNASVTSTLDWSTFNGQNGNPTPALQIKNNCVAINKLIPHDTTPIYALDVNGRAEIYNSSSDTVLNLRSNNDNVTYIEFKNSSNNTMGFIGLNSAHIGEIAYGNTLKKIMDNSMFSVSGTTLTITLP